MELIEVEDSDDIDVIIKNWYFINKMLKELKEKDESLRNKMKIYLKEREWTSYSNKENKINIKITKHEKETANIKELKNILSDVDFSKVVKVTSFEKLNIITPEIRSRMSKFSK